jgi:hypothetical protein
MKACRTWAAFNRREAKTYYRKLAKLYWASYKTYKSAKTPENYATMYYNMYVRNFFHGNRWHRANYSCRCAGNLIKRYARPFVRKYLQRVQFLKRRLVKVTNPKLVRLIRLRLRRAHLRLKTVRILAKGRRGRREIKQIIQHYHKYQRLYKRTTKLGRKVMIKRRFARYQIMYRVILKYRSWRRVMIRRKATRRMIRTTSVRRRVVKNTLRKISNLKRKLRISSAKRRAIIRKKIVILRRQARVVRRNIIAKGGKTVFRYRGRLYRRKIKSVRR